MTKTFSICAATALAAFGVQTQAQAQEITGRVISATPVVQQVQVPRTVCSNQPVAVQQSGSGAGKPGLRKSSIRATALLLAAALHPFIFIRPMKSRLPSGAPLWRRMS